jgi:hypothetical protein
MDMNEIAAQSSTMDRIAIALENIVKQLQRLNARDHARFMQDYNTTPRPGTAPWPIEKENNDNAGT